MRMFCAWPTVSSCNPAVEIQAFGVSDFENPCLRECCVPLVVPDVDFFLPFVP